MLKHICLSHQPPEMFSHLKEKGDKHICFNMNFELKMDEAKLFFKH
jgi:hypothetical protein